MAQGEFLFTSEAVSMGHPDKLADQISDGVLDALFAKDPYSRAESKSGRNYAQHAAFRRRAFAVSIGKPAPRAPGLHGADERDAKVPHR